ncbi:hypothetical protein MUP01_04735 [Candidatus Bathyarchaeota archaeon]|nr:hypothetical protein [Candidatus Bathyarchaeota archaeon]
MSLTFSLTKGLLYGIFVGILFGLGIYLTSTAVVGLGWLAMPPVSLAALVFANGILGGVSHEYGVWLKNTHNGGLLFNLTLGFLDGVTLGLYFGLGTYLMGLVVVGMGWLLGITAVQLASLVFAICILMMLTYNYAVWFDKQRAEAATVSAPAATI